MSEHPEFRSGRAPRIYPYWLEMWHTGRQMEPVLDRYESALARQIRLGERLACLSPAVLAGDALNELSGTSAGRYLRFRQARPPFNGNGTAFSRHGCSPDGG